MELIMKLLGRLYYVTDVEGTNDYDRYRIESKLLGI